MLNSLFGPPKELILVVEDEPEPALLIETFLKRRGFRVEIAKDGQEGVEKAQKLKPDLVLLDIMLPGIDGMNVLLALKAKPEIKDIPVIMCTALNGIKEVERCCKWGAAGYVTKPFELARVHEKILSALADRKK